MVMQALSQLLSTFLDSVFTIIGAADATKKLKFDASAQGTGVTTTISVGAQTGNHTATVPVLSGNDIFAFLNVSEAFTQAQAVDLGTGALPAVTSGATFRLAQADTVGSAMEGISYGATGLSIRGRSVGGTRASNSGTAANQALANFLGYGHNGTAVTTSPSARMTLFALNAWTGTDTSTAISFNSTPAGSTTAGEVARLTSNFLIGTATDIAGTGGLKVAGTTASTSPTTGALQVGGGAGFGGAVFAGGAVHSFGPGGTSGNAILHVNGGNSGTAGGAAVYFDNNGSTNAAVGDYSAIVGGAYNTSLVLFSSSGVVAGLADPGGSDALRVGGALTISDSKIMTTKTAFTNGAAAALGTLTNAPTAGNPTKWIPINDNGTTRYIPAW